MATDSSGLFSYGVGRLGNTSGHLYNTGHPHHLTEIDEDFKWIVIALFWSIWPIIVLAGCLGNVCVLILTTQRKHISMFSSVHFHMLVVLSSVVFLLTLLDWTILPNMDSSEYSPKFCWIVQYLLSSAMMASNWVIASLFVSRMVLVVSPAKIRYFVKRAAPYIVVTSIVLVVFGVEFLFRMMDGLSLQMRCGEREPRDLDAWLHPLNMVLYYILPLVSMVSSVIVSAFNYKDIISHEIDKPTQLNKLVLGGLYKRKASSAHVKQNWFLPIPFITSHQIRRQSPPKPHTIVMESLKLIATGANPNIDLSKSHHSLQHCHVDGVSNKCKTDSSVDADSSSVDQHVHNDVRFASLHSHRLSKAGFLKEEIERQLKETDAVHKRFLRRSSYSRSRLLSESELTVISSFVFEEIADLPHAHESITTEEGMPRRPSTLTTSGSPSDPFAVSSISNMPSMFKHNESELFTIEESTLSPEQLASISSSTTSVPIVIVDVSNFSRPTKNKTLKRSVRRGSSSGPLRDGDFIIADVSNYVPADEMIKTNHSDCSQSIEPREPPVSKAHDDTFTKSSDSSRGIVSSCESGSVSPSVEGRIMNRPCHGHVGFEIANSYSTYENDHRLSDPFRQGAKDMATRSLDSLYKIKGVHLDLMTEHISYSESHMNERRSSRDGPKNLVPTVAMSKTFAMKYRMASRTPSFHSPRSVSEASSSTSSETDSSVSSLELDPVADLPTQQIKRLSKKLSASAGSRRYSTKGLLTKGYMIVAGLTDGIWSLETEMSLPKPGRLTNKRTGVKKKSGEAFIVNDVPNERKISFRPQMRRIRPVLVRNRSSMEMADNVSHASSIVYAIIGKQWDTDVDRCDVPATRNAECHHTLCDDFEHFEDVAIIKPRPVSSVHQCSSTAVDIVAKNKLEVDLYQLEEIDFYTCGSDAPAKHNHLVEAVTSDSITDSDSGSSSRSAYAPQHLPQHRRTAAVETITGLIHARALAASIMKADRDKIKNMRRTGSTQVDSTVVDVESSEKNEVTSQSNFSGKSSSYSSMVISDIVDKKGRFSKRMSLKRRFRSFMSRVKPEKKDETERRHAKTILERQTNEHYRAVVERLRKVAKEESEKSAFDEFYSSSRATSIGHPPSLLPDIKGCYVIKEQLLLEMEVQSSMPRSIIFTKPVDACVLEPNKRLLQVISMKKSNRGRFIRKLSLALILWMCLQTPWVCWVLANHWAQGDVGTNHSGVIVWRVTEDVTNLIRCSLAAMNVVIYMSFASGVQNIVCYFCHRERETGEMIASVSQETTTTNVESAVSTELNSVHVLRDSGGGSVELE